MNYKFNLIKFISHSHSNSISNYIYKCRRPGRIDNATRPPLVAFLLRVVIVRWRVFTFFSYCYYNPCPGNNRD